MPKNQRTSRARPSPGEFGDFRPYLRAVVAYLKAHERGFSHRKFAQRAGYASSGFLRDVMDGRRNLSVSGIAKFAKGLALSPRETEAFEALVLMTQAGSDEERNRHYERLHKLAGSKSEYAQFTRDQYEVLTAWYAFPIREMLLLPDFKEDSEWIAKRLRPAIRPGEAKKALELLERTGMAVRGTDGKLRPADPKVTTPASVSQGPQALAVRNFHRALLESAAGTLDGLSQEERNIISLTLKLTPRQYEELCKRNMEYLREVLDESGASNGPQGEGQEVFVLGMQLFPVTKGRGKS